MHKPVLLDKVLEYLAPKDGATYVDATFGAGGYTRAILEAAGCKVYAIDRDETVLPTAEKLAKEFPERFELLQGEFANIDKLVKEKVDGVVFDIGVSSMQLDQAERGFSFMRDGPLDMRMGKDNPLTAADIVNTYPERELANLIFQYGGEKKSRTIAKAIVKARGEEKIETTGKLASIIRQAVGRYNDDIDPATRTFQAIRIVVNDELNQLQKGLKGAKSLLEVGGRLVVVTFHSDEDKIVKNYFKELCGKDKSFNRHMPGLPEEEEAAEFEYLHKGTVIAGEKELGENSRSRSAKLRAVIKVR